MISVLLTALLASSAHAADHEVSVEWGVVASSDDTLDLFGANYLPTRGLRAGLAVHRNLAIVGGWHRGRRGVRFTTEDGQSGQMAYFADAFTLGAKADFELFSFLLPYVTTQAILWRGTMKFDDEPDDRTSPGQVRVSALAPGGLFAGGLELRIPKADAPFTLAWHVEAGYALVARHAYRGGSTVTDDGRTSLGDDVIATAKPGGFALRTGLGVRF